MTILIKNLTINDYYSVLNMDSIPDKVLQQVIHQDRDRGLQAQLIQHLYFNKQQDLFITGLAVMVESLDPLKGETDFSQV